MGKVKIVEDFLKINSEVNLPLRIYSPDVKKNLPIIVFFHGGIIAGQLKQYDYILKRIAKELNHVVIAPEYRVFQYYKYPNAQRDSKNLFLNAFDILDRNGISYTNKISLMGDSIGGSLAAELVSDLKGYSGGVDGLILLYPALDYSSSNKSRDALIEGRLFQRVFNEYFLTESQRKLSSPIFKTIEEGFPKTLLVTCGGCPFKDEGFIYKKKLMEKGVDVTHLHLPKMKHGFFNLDNIFPNEVQVIFDYIKNFFGSK